MATRKAKAGEPVAKAAPIEDIDVLTYVEGAMRTYGRETNLDRAIPDFRDGLKPVHRRSLWAMAAIGLVSSTREVKAARIVGDTIGKLHPHGDTSAYGAIVTLVNSPAPAVDGVGNWGTLIDGAAAYRYTNARFTAYGKLMFHKDYFPTVPMLPNFDKEWKEPLLIPTLLPNLLFNGASGIGVGVRTEIPAFTPSSVIKMMIRILSGEKPDPSEFASQLDFYNQYGGTVAKSKENLESITNLFSSTSGSVVWTCDLEVVEAKKQIVIKGFCPDINPTKLVEDKLKPMAEVRSVTAGDGLSYVIQVNSSLNMNEFNRVVAQIRRLTTAKVSYECYVTQRRVREDDPEKCETDFFCLSVPQIFVRWLRWRIQLEKDSLDYRIDQTNRKIRMLDLLILACDNLKVIFDALKTKDPAAFIAKGLEITVDEANLILDRKVRQLSRLDASKLQAERATLKTFLKDLKGRRSQPQQEVLDFMKRALKFFERKEIYTGTYAWIGDPKVAKTLVSGQVSTEDEAEVEAEDAE